MRCGAVWCGVVWGGVVWCSVICRVVWCGAVQCGMVWCGVPKALLPNGNGRDALHMGNAKREGCVVWCGVLRCRAKALLPKGNGQDGLARGRKNVSWEGCVSKCTLCVWCVSAGPRCSALVWAADPLQWGGTCTCPGCGALVALPSRRAPPPPSASTKKGTHASVREPLD